MTLAVPIATVVSVVRFNSEVVAQAAGVEML